MGTVRCITWVGCRVSELRPVPAHKHELQRFLDALDQSPNGVQQFGYTFHRILMHGTPVGYGVLISTVAANEKLDDENLIDAHIEHTAMAAVVRSVAGVLNRLNCPTTPRIWRHIDLGR